MKKILTIPIVLLVYATSTHAVTLPGIRKGIQNLRREIKTEIKEKIGQTAKVIGAKIIAIDGATVMVTKDGTTYTIRTDDSTLLRRHFWGTSSLSEYSVGNTVNIWGTYTDDIKQTIHARLMRNLSIQKRFGVFFGTVFSKTDTTLVLQTVNRDNQTVTIAGATSIDRKEQSISYNQILVGHKIRIKGMWDKRLSTVTEVAQIKDFSIPEPSTSQ